MKVKLSEDGWKLRPKEARIPVIQRTKISTEILLRLQDYRINKSEQVSCPWSRDLIVFTVRIKREQPWNKRMEINLPINKTNNQDKKDKWISNLPPLLRSKEICYKKREKVVKEESKNIGNH